MLWSPCIDLIIVQHKVLSHPSSAKDNDVGHDEHDDDYKPWSTGQYIKDMMLFRNHQMEDDNVHDAEKPLLVCLV